MLAKGAKLTVLAVKVSILAIAVAFLYGLTTFYLFGGRFLGLEEKGVLITDVEINTGETVTPDILMGWLGVERDAPLFASRRFGANDLRAAMVRAMANPTLASLYVSREFTGKVTIHATERKPLARIAGRGLAIDRDGYVFAFRKTGKDSLVDIEGSVPAGLQAGNRIVPSSLDASIAMAQGRSVPSAMGVAALRLIDYLAEGTSPLPLSAIGSINTDNQDYLKIIFKDGRTARLAWDCMKSSQAADGLDYLAAQIAGLAKAMTSREGRAHRHFDFTIKGRGYGLR